jgi:anti-sigma B factor antagonist
MDADFSVTEALRGGCCVLVLEGELDMAEAPTLDAALDACPDGLPVIVDLSSLTFLDSSGLHVLLRDREAGRLAAVVRIPGSNVARVLDLVDATKALQVYDDVALAVEQLGDGS